MNHWFFNEPNQRIPQPPEFLFSFIKSMSTRNFPPRKTLHASEMAGNSRSKATTETPLFLSQSLHHRCGAVVCFPHLGDLWVAEMQFEFWSSFWWVFYITPRWTKKHPGHKKPTNSWERSDRSLWILSDVRVSPQFRSYHKNVDSSNHIGPNCTATTETSSSVCGWRNPLQSCWQ